MSQLRSKTGRTTTSSVRCSAALQDQLDRAVNDAFSGPFLLAAALALAALVPLLLMGRPA